MFGGLFDSESESESKSKSKQKTKGQQQDLSAELLKSLEGLLGGQLGGVAQANDALGNRLSEIGGMDVASRAQAISGKAINDVDLGLESDLNQLFGQIGGSSNNSSMGALLRSRLQNDAVTTKAGILGNTEMQLDQMKTSGINDTANSLNSSIMQLLGLTRGAKTSGRMTTKGTAAGNSSTTESDSPFGSFTKILGLFK